MNKELTLHNLVTNPAARKKPKRKGRGVAAGCGKTAGRGTKGQKSRSSGGVRPGFEGGQNPWFRRLPKRGFKNPNHKKYVVINLDTISKHYQDNDTVTLDSLRKKGLVPLNAPHVKLLGRGKLTKKVTLDLPAVSRAAQLAANNKAVVPKITKPSFNNEK